VPARARACVRMARGGLWGSLGNTSPLRGPPRRRQAAALDTSVPAIPRLGVPALPSGEALHGVACGRPHPRQHRQLGLPDVFPCRAGAAFDAPLWQARRRTLGGGGGAFDAPLCSVRRWTMGRGGGHASTGAPLDAWGMPRRVRGARGCGQP